MIEKHHFRLFIHARAAVAVRRGALANAINRDRSTATSDDFFVQSPKIYANLALLEARKLCKLRHLSKHSSYHRMEGCISTSGGKLFRTNATPFEHCDEITAALRQHLATP